MKKEGKIKHIGFSTHGSGEVITKLIDSEEFEFVNLHYHYFGSYHAEGTPNPYGGHGNAASVKRALELDMGVFNISPIDKGGMLQNPSAIVARTIGPKLTPIAFSLLTGWKNGLHTATVGFGRPTDLDETAEAASLVDNDEANKEVEAAVDRLEKLAREKLGDEWYEKGLLNIPSYFEKETDFIGIGHILWLHNIVSAFGMYNFAKQRYKMLEAERPKWKPNKMTFEENLMKMSDANPCISFDPNVDLTKALSKHYNPKLAKEKLIEAHSWLCKDTTFTEEELAARGWNAAYDLQTWDIFPGTDVDPIKIVLQNITRGRYGLKDSGPSDETWLATVKAMRAMYKESANL